MQYCARVFVNRAAIDLSTDLSNRISIVTSKPNSECVDATDDRVAVNFGENLRSGCFIKYADCGDLNSLICNRKIVLKTAFCIRFVRQHASNYLNRDFLIMAVWCF